MVGSYEEKEGPGASQGKRERRKGRGKRDSGKEGMDTRTEKRKWEGNRRDWMRG